MTFFDKLFRRLIVDILTGLKKFIEESNDKKEK
jgi:hypothetical protein